MTRRYAPRTVLASHFDTQVREERREAALPRIPAPVTPSQPPSPATEPPKRLTRIVVESRPVGRPSTSGRLDDDTIARALDQVFGDDEKKPR